MTGDYVELNFDFKGGFTESGINEQIELNLKPKVSFYRVFEDSYRPDFYDDKKLARIMAYLTTNNIIKPKMNFEDIERNTQLFPLERRLPFFRYHYTGITVNFPISCL